jgi:hypothetical protein
MGRVPDTTLEKEAHMDRKIHVYNRYEDLIGYIRLGKDDIGRPIGEVYNKNADRVGALEYNESNITTTEGLIYNQQGDQIGYVLVEALGEEPTEGEVFFNGQTGVEDNMIAHVHLSGSKNGIAEVYSYPSGGEKIGKVEPVNASHEELLVAGGAASLLLLI